MLFKVFLSAINFQRVNHQPKKSHFHGSISFKMLVPWQANVVLRLVVNHLVLLLHF